MEQKEKTENGKTALRVWISEDDHDDQFIFTTAIREIVPGAELRFFFTSQDLIQDLLKTTIMADNGEGPDLIIGDLKTPFFDLKDVAEIRTFRQFEKIPLYVFAEVFSDITCSRAVSLGATGFYHKPNSLHSLKDILAGIIQKKSNTAASREISEQPVPDEE